ncbi:MAG: hypothetical protein WD431_19270 [Cyclobacteriaceae bacterium]
MTIVVLKPVEQFKLEKKKVELVKINNKYYIELEEFENLDSIVELSIALAQENEALKERIMLLEGGWNIMKE